MKSYGPNSRRSHPLFETWKMMKRRCKSKTGSGYERYGARGITVCDRWDKSFRDFVADVGDKPGDDYSLDRIDNSKGYEPSNVQWATPAMQARNKRTNRVLEYKGKSLCLKDMAREFNINPDTLRSRIDEGWDVADAIETPVSAKNMRGVSSK